MSRPHAAEWRLSAAQWIALALIAAVVCLTAAYLLLALELHRGGSAATNLVLFLIVGSVGFLLAFRLTDRPIGWLLLGVVVSVQLKNVCAYYAILNYHVHHGHLPLGLLAAIVVDGQSGLLGVIFLAPAVLLLPDGRIPSVRWRWVWRTYLTLAAILVIGQVVAAFSLIGQHIQVNSAGDPTNNEGGILGDFGLTYVAAFGLLPIMLSWVVYQVVAFLRSTGVVRQQMKWLLAGAIVCTTSLMFVLLNSTTPQFVRLGVAALPIAIAITVFRYHLYEIDRVISRTLSYLVLTGLVVGSYVGLVTLTERAFGFSSPVAVAASTLCAAALFAPLRRRIQHLVDRQFNRARFDSEAIVSRFAVKLRDEIQTEAVKTELVATISHAIEPVRVAVWTAPSVRNSTTTGRG